jgi:hypothetical protein
MAKSKKQSKLIQKQLILHCKCNACTHWEILFRREDGVEDDMEIEIGRFSLKCASCGVTVDFDELDVPHAGLHWEKMDA